MIINLSYEIFIRSLELFYIGKLQMSLINAKATNIKYNALYMCKWQCNQKAQRESYFMRKIYPLRSQFHKSNNKSPTERCMH